MIRSFKLSELASKVGCDVTGADVSFSKVSIDSRDCENALFVALKGDRHDAHDYIDQACANDCEAVVAEYSEPSQKPFLKVADTYEALGWLGNLNRSAFTGKVVALTGSSGKTTTKNMLQSILSQAGTCLATHANHNNEIGVPLTLLSIGAEHDFAVVEMGARKLGDINYLGKFAEPDTVMVLNAGTAHIGEFGGYENIVKGKGELYGCVSPQGAAVLNMDDPAVKQWELMIPSGAEVIRYSSQLNRASDLDTNPIELSLSQLSLDALSSRFLLHWQGQTVEISLSLPGEHNVNNAMAASAAALSLGVNLNHIKAGLALVSGGPGRMSRVNLMSGVTLIDDSYNANPASMKAAISVLAMFEGEKIAVMGHMAELGKDSERYHRQLGEDLRAASIDAVFIVGEFSASVAEGFGNQAYVFATHEQLSAALAKHLMKNQKLAKDAMILVKGSRSAQMEVIVSQLAEELQ